MEKEAFAVNKLRALYKLARPFNALSGALAVFLGGYVARTGEWDKVAMAALVTLLMTGAGNAWNDYPSGLVSPPVAWIYALVLTGIALVIAAFINLPSFIVALLAALVLLVYSWKLKSTVLVGNATVAAMSALSIIFGGIAAGNVVPTLLLAFIVAVAIMGREVLKTLADYEGDLRQRVRTISTIWGRRPARIVFFLFIAATGWVMMLPYLLDLYKPVYAYIVALGVYPVLFYAVTKVTRLSTGRQLERVSQVMKLDFLVWFVAVLFGASI